MDSKNENKKWQNTDELKETLENIRCRHSEVEEMVMYLQSENKSLKKKYHDYRRRLYSLNEFLEKNAKVFHELFNDTRCALQMGRTSVMNSPLLQKQSPLVEVNNSQDRSSNDSPLGCSTPLLTRKKSLFQPQTCNDKIAAVPSTSTASNDVHQVKNIFRHKIHVEPINMREIEEACVAVAEETPQPRGDTCLRESLSIIEEEPSNVRTQTITNEGGPNMSMESNSVQFDSDNMKKSFVNLERLPSDIMKYHVQKIMNNSVASSHTSSNDTDSLSDQCEHDYSTKMDQTASMNLLGLIPTREVPDKTNIYKFVNTRKKYSTRINSIPNGLISPKKERFSKRLYSKSLKRETISPRQVPSNSPKKERTSAIRHPVTLKKVLSNSPKKERTSAILHPVGLKNEKSLSPKHEKPKSGSMKRTGNTPVEPELINKKRKPSPTVEVTNSRPVRKAKPTQLKEGSLKRKMRRS